MAKRFTDKGPSQRQLRAGELIRHALADLLQRGDLRDPGVRDVSVTVAEVRVSPDLKNATAYCMPLGGENAEGVIAGLNRSAAFLRGQLGREIDMKHTPALKFELDRTFGEAERIDAILKRADVRRDIDN